MVVLLRTAKSAPRRRQCCARTTEVGPGSQGIARYRVQARPKRRTSAEPQASAVMSLRKMWGLITVLCAAPAVPLGGVLWVVLPDRPGYGVVTLVCGVAVAAVGGLLMWFGRHPVPRPAAPPATDRATFQARDLQDA